MRIAVFALGLAAGIAAQPATQAAAPLVEPLLGRLVQTASAEAPANPALCAPMQLNIYFPQNETGLSMPARATLDVVGARMRGCAISAVAIEAGADDIATPEGRKLAGLRGATVLKELSARGLAPAAVIIGQRHDNEPASADAAPAHMRLVIDASRRDARASAQEKAPSIPDNEI